MSYLAAVAVAIEDTEESAERVGAVRVAHYGAVLVDLVLCATPPRLHPVTAVRGDHGRIEGPLLSCDLLPELRRVGAHINRRPGAGRAYRAERRVAQRGRGTVSGGVHPGGRATRAGRGGDPSEGHGLRAWGRPRRAGRVHLCGATVAHECIALAHWYMVHWRSGAYWNLGALVHWCIGALVHWCIGALA